MIDCRRLIKETVENLHVRIAILDGTTLQQVIQELVDLILQYRALPALTTACLSPLGTRGENLLGLLLRRMIESERLGTPTTWAGKLLMVHKRPAVIDVNKT